METNKAKERQGVIVSRAELQAALDKLHSYAAMSAATAKKEGL